MKRETIFITGASAGIGEAAACRADPPRCRCGGRGDYKRGEHILGEQGDTWTDE